MDPLELYGLETAARLRFDLCIFGCVDELENVSMVDDGYVLCDDHLRD